MLVLSSPENLRLLHESEFIMADGTFKYAPKGVQQVYIIHYQINTTIRSLQINASE